MRFSDDPREPSQSVGNRIVVGLRYGSRIEQAAGVIQLYLIDGRRLASELPTGLRNLTWNCASGCVGFGGVLPKVTHQAAPRAFASGEEHGCDSCDAPIRRPLILDHYALRPPGVV